MKDALFAAGVSRRTFLGGLAGLAAAGASGGDVRAPGGAARFLICSDLHLETVPWGRAAWQNGDDAASRHEGTIPAILAAAAANACDFVLNLGDFLMPKSRYGSPDACLSAWWATDVFAGERFHVLGNHDVELSTKAQCLEAYRMPGRYYAFDRGAWHFVVLDAQCVRREDGTCVDYAGRQSGSGYSFVERSFVDDEQLAWLRADLAATRRRCLVFSHQCLTRSVGNAGAVRAVLEEANRRAGYRKVVAAFSGHHHSNYDLTRGGIRYLQVNSANYFYVGAAAREDSDRRYPGIDLGGYTALLRSSYPYAKTLFAIVEADARGLRVRGMEAGFVPPAPPSAQSGGLPAVAWIRDAAIRL